MPWWGRCPVQWCVQCVKVWHTFAMIDVRGAAINPEDAEGGPVMQKFLHVGCGQQTKHNLKGFSSSTWEEVRFDIDEKVKPDIVGTLTDMTSVESESVDAVFSSHNLEHVYAHEVITALREFYRVLKEDGFVVVTCPDLQSVCEAIVQDKLLQPLFVSPAGPISPVDVLYGHRDLIASGNTYMAHKCGFTYSVLQSSVFNAGFKNTFGGRRPEHYDLWMVAFKQDLDESKMREMAQEFLP